MLIPEPVQAYMCFPLVRTFIFIRYTEGFGLVESGVSGYLDAARVRPPELGDKAFIRFWE